MHRYECLQLPWEPNCLVQTLTTVPQVRIKEEQSHSVSVVSRIHQTSTYSFLEESNALHPCCFCLTCAYVPCYAHGHTSSDIMCCPRTMRLLWLNTCFRHQSHIPHCVLSHAARVPIRKGTAVSGILQECTCCLVRSLFFKGTDHPKNEHTLFTC